METVFSAIEVACVATLLHKYFYLVICVIACIKTSDTFSDCLAEMRRPFRSNALATAQLFSKFLYFVEWPLLIIGAYYTYILFKWAAILFIPAIYLHAVLPLDSSPLNSLTALLPKAVRNSIQDYIGSFAKGDKITFPLLAVCEYWPANRHGYEELFRYEGDIEVTEHDYILLLDKLRQHKFELSHNDWNYALKNAEILYEACKLEAADLIKEECDPDENGEYPYSYVTLYIPERLLEEFKRKHYL